MITVSDLPSLNAALNGISGVLLVAGFYLIRRKKVVPHKVCMLGAFSVSILFLISYSIYHYQVGSKPFLGQGWVRYFYFGILIPHVTLAAIILPMAIVTVQRAWKQELESHRRVARWTLPIWLYVSITGVLIYLMLYRF